MSDLRARMPWDAPPTCVKRAYVSEHAARRANRHARFRIRAYHCPRCRRWHVTNQDKDRP